MSDTNPYRVDNLMKNYPKRGDFQAPNYDPLRVDNLMKNYP